jgi:hypothetical protein
MNEGWKEDYEALPKAGSHRLINFEEASVVTDRPPAFPPQFLEVSGRKPYANMWVDLAPLAYVRHPEYWGIEVVGRLPLGIGLPSEELPSEEVLGEAQKAQYIVTIPLYSGITGTEGIELIGATRSERIEVRHEPTAGECSEWSAWRNLEPGGPVSLHVTGECRFPDTRYEIELRRREPQGINPKDLLLELIVTERRGWADEETTLTTHYSEQTDFEYETVTILPDGVVVPVGEAW